MKIPSAPLLALLLVILMTGCSSVPGQAKKAGRTVARTGEVVATKAESFWNRVFGKKKTAPPKANRTQNPANKPETGFQTYAQPYVTNED